MHAPAKDTCAPDPKCCGCGLKPRCLANDLLRLILIVLLLLPLLLMLFGCKEHRGSTTPSVASAPVDCPVAAAGPGGGDCAAGSTHAPQRRAQG